MGDTKRIPDEITVSEYLRMQDRIAALEREQELAFGAYALIAESHGDPDCECDFCEANAVSPLKALAALKGGN